MNTRAGGQEERGQKRKANKDLNLHWGKEDDAVYMQADSAR